MTETTPLETRPVIHGEFRRYIWNKQSLKRSYEIILDERAQYFGLREVTAAGLIGNAINPGDTSHRQSLMVKAAFRQMADEEYKDRQNQITPAEISRRADETFVREIYKTFDGMIGVYDAFQCRTASLCVPTRLKALGNVLDILSVMQYAATNKTESSRRPSFDRASAVLSTVSKHLPPNERYSTSHSRKYWIEFKKNVSLLYALKMTPYRKGDMLGCLTSEGFGDDYASYMDGIQESVRLATLFSKRVLPAFADREGFREFEVPFPQVGDRELPQLPMRDIVRTETRERFGL